MRKFNMYMYPQLKEKESSIRWHINVFKDPILNVTVHKIYCPRCGDLVVAYRDQKKMIPFEAEHCGMKETFYIGEQVNV